MQGSLHDFRLFLLSNGYAKRTVDSCLEYITSYLSKNDFSHESVVRYIAGLKERGIKNTTINRYIDYLNSYSRYLGRENLTLKHFKTEKSFTKRILTDEQIERFLNLPPHKFENKAKYEKNLMFWKLCFYTGCRMGEVAKLKPEHFDFDNWEINIKDTKTYMSRKVPIAQAIRSDVYEYVSRVEPGQYVCYMSSSAWRKAFERRLEKLGIKKVQGLSPYSIRHTAATNLVKTTGVMSAKRILGHKELSTTEQYIHLDTQALHDAINSMTYARGKISPKEKIDIFLRDVVKAFFWDESEFDISVEKREGELKLKVKARP